MSLFKNNLLQLIQRHHFQPSSQLVVGVLCGIFVSKLWNLNWNFKNKGKQSEKSVEKRYEITRFQNIFGSNVYRPCKCGFPHQVCNECKNEKLSTEFPANVLLFSKSLENEIPSGGIAFTFDVPLTTDTIESISNQLDVSVPVQYGTVMIHYRGTPPNGSSTGYINMVEKLLPMGEVELLWCANTSDEAKNVFPMIELLSRIVQIRECSEALGYKFKPITSMIIHDIDVYTGL